MTKENKASAEEARAEIEKVASVALPEPANDAITPLETAPPPLADEIRTRMAEIDLHDSQSVIRFGSRAQTDLQEISQAMLADVRNKEVGPAGDSLRDIVSTIRGFSVSELDMRRKRSWWEKLLGRAAPFANFIASYEEVQGQIDNVTDELLAHEHKLLKDIKALDLLYDRTLGFHDELALYIAAGEARLKQLDDEEIPALSHEAEATAGDSEGSDGKAVMQAQELRDLRSIRDDLERRVHDLKLTRQVTMQSLPSIRLVQENDKSLVTRINSTLVNTVPLWETQLAQAVTIQRSAEAAQSVRQASDLTNDLLTANAKNLRTANAAIRTEAERGVFDIEAVRTANAELISTIEDSLRIADEGKARRAAAEAELVQLEGDLRTALAASHARAPQPPTPPESGSGPA